MTSSTAFNNLQARLKEAVICDDIAADEAAVVAQNARLKAGEPSAIEIIWIRKAAAASRTD